MPLAFPFPLLPAEVVGGGPPAAVALLAEGEADVEVAEAVTAAGGGSEAANVVGNDRVVGGVPLCAYKTNKSINTGKTG